MKDDYKQGDRVKFLPSSTLKGTGIVCGKATTGAAGVGKSWIIQPDSPLPVSYGYSHCILFSNMIEPVS